MTHSKLDLIQLLLKLFNLELKENDPIVVAPKIKDIMYGVKVYLPLNTFIKVIYLTYSHCLEPLQASGWLEDLKFDTLVEKNVETEKILWKEATSSHWRDYMPCSERDEPIMWFF